jgi:predicted nucleotidyltransferase
MKQEALEEKFEMQLAEAVAYLQRNIPTLRAVYLFGSQATGDIRAESDVDLAVLADASLEELYRYDLMGELAEILGREVDLLDLQNASTVLRIQVIGKGRRLFSTGRAALEEFEDRVFVGYARLNEERAAILADIRKRGSIYGR